MSATAERPSITTILARTNSALEIHPHIEKALEESLRDKASEVNLKRIQRDQRYAISLNAVTQARKHSGRDPEVASPEDAGIVNMIFSLLQKVADEAIPSPDKIFFNIPELTTDAFLEFAIASCAKQSAQKGNEESPPSTEPPVSNENSGG